MRTWIENFKPKMITFVRPCLEDETAVMVQAVCADRVFRVRYLMALKTCKTEEERNLMRKMIERS